MLWASRTDGHRFILQWTQALMSLAHTHSAGHAEILASAHQEFFIGNASICVVIHLGQHDTGNQTLHSSKPYIK